jgi:predicted anti-sigma-YlaC factor YlaD
MDCNDYQKHMSLLIDGELGQHSLQALETHLAGCSGCRNAYGRMEALNSALKDVDLYRPPSMLASRVKARFDEESGPPRARLIPSAWRPVPLLALIVLLAIGVGNLAGRSMTEILVGDQSEAKLEYLLTDAGQSFSDIVLDIAVEENSR